MKITHVRFVHKIVLLVSIIRFVHYVLKSIMWMKINYVLVVHKSVRIVRWVSNVEQIVIMQLFMIIRATVYKFVEMAMLWIMVVTWELGQNWTDALMTAKLRRVSIVIQANRKQVYARIMT